MFTVKSAYFIAAKLQADKDLGKCSSGDSNSIIWKKLWKLKLPPKVKIFSLRACVNGLPVFLKLAERGIHLGCDCPACGEEVESLTHTLILCDFALSVWSLWQDCPLMLLVNATNFIDLVHNFCTSPNVEHLEYFFAIAWAIWHNRNLLVHNEKGLSPLQVWDLARSVLEDFHEANDVLCSTKQSSNDGWISPPPGFFKVNVDGASPLDGKGISGVGAIVRNDEGKVVAALCKALPVCFPAEWAELFALEQGVLLAQQLAISNVVFESDAASVIQAILQDLCGGVAGHIIQGIQRAKSSFASCSFSHVKRAHNGAAHKLAQFAKWNNASHVWKDNFPLFLDSLLQSDYG